VVDTKTKILDFIKENGASKAKEITEFIGISPQAIHRHLKLLVEQAKLSKKGSPPVVFYELSGSPEKLNASTLDDEIYNYLEENYSYLSPTGQFLCGAKAFKIWCQTTKQEHLYPKLAAKFMLERRKLFQLFKDKPIDAREKIKKTFQEVHLEHVYYSEFWSLPQFGRSHFGNLLTAGKSGQQKKSIFTLASLCEKDINFLIKKHKVNAVAFAAHSIPRRISFLKLFSKKLNLKLPWLSFQKVVTNGIPIAQKSLKKLPERILNARETIFLNEKNIEHNVVLLIDDAIGSGATLNELALKLKKQGVKKVIAYGIVGSLKGFDVISEI